MSKLMELAREAGFSTNGAVVRTIHSNGSWVSVNGELERFYELARADLEAEIAELHTTMMAAAVEIQAHWEHHCDAEGYGPANLMHRLEQGIASQYGYDAKTIVRMDKRIEELEAENAKLREALEEMVASDEEAIADVAAIGVEFPEELLTTYKKARAALGEKS